ncbi:hypothetical protein EMIHUDRAFT_471743, partial [Emiliania huxleyi CCMP1516]|uniref:gamma-glutamylcyclotransferase n=2 Tax=Emiliania huxleyi TaxID=2903 RepID=A0A0D3IZ09_EMIH1
KRPPLEPRALPSTVLAPDGSVRYFAYGSNLGRQKVLSRGAASIISTERANVAGWRLAFTFALNPPLEPSFASIEPAPAETVCEGVLHTLTPSAYEELWRSEGGGGSRPDYDEIVVLAKPWSGSEPVRAITLRAAQSRRLSHDVPPSQRYLSIVVAGAHEAGLSPAYIARLEAISAAAPSGFLAAVAEAHGLLLVLLYLLGLQRLLSPLRAICFLLHRHVRPRLRDIATGLLLLPTAAIGAATRPALRLLGRERWLSYARYGQLPPTPATTLASARCVSEYHYQSR